MSSIGKMVHEEWHKIQEIRVGTIVDTFQVMPNHLHGILFLPAEADSPIRQRLSNVISGFKAAVTSSARRISGNSQLRVWQRGFDEHVIRSERELQRIRTYIEENPWNWNLDRERPKV